jgi:double-stranded uracil-DNA glycosylase
VFCGTAAGAVAARVGAPYAGPGNRFWWVLHETGLTPRQLEPAEFRTLPRYGIGLTDAAKHTSGPDSGLVRADFDPAAVIAKVERYAPWILAFVGKRAAQEVLARPVTYGPQEGAIGVSDVWVVPSTSGAARGAWHIHPWQELARRLRSTAATGRPHPPPSDGPQRPPGSAPRRGAARSTDTGRTSRDRTA